MSTDLLILEEEEIFNLVVVMQEMVHHHFVPEKDDLLMMRVQIGNVKILQIFKAIATEVVVMEVGQVNQKGHGSEVVLIPQVVLPEHLQEEVKVLGVIVMITLVVVEDQMMILDKVEVFKQG